MSAAPKFKNNVKISQRHGAREWLLEKILLLILMPLSIWVAFTGFMAIRAVILGMRVATDRWMITGAPRS